MTTFQINSFYLSYSVYKSGISTAKNIQREALEILRKFITPVLSHFGNQPFLVTW